MSHIGTVGFERLNLDIFPQDHYFRKLQAWLDRNMMSGKFFDYVLVNGVPIHFVKTYKNIGVNFSAGGDSTMLMLILAEIISHLKCKTKIFPLSMSRFYDVSNFKDENIEEVHTYLKNKYPEIIQPIVWGFIPTAFEQTPLKNIVFPDNKTTEQFQFFLENNATSDVMYFHYYNDWASKKYNLDAVYNGCTTNPVTEEFIPGVPEFRNAPDNLFNTVPWIYKYPTLEYLLSINPFERMEKSWVTAQYINFEVQDLFDLTQSCVTVAGGCKDYDQCFHCAEREWSYRNSFYYLKENAYEF